MLKYPKKMGLNKLIAIWIVALVEAIPIAVSAQESIYIPLFTYRTGPFAGSGIHIANGMHDYLEMLNQRDGGILGVKLVIEECETGYDTQKGLECYEAAKPKKPAVINPWSTGTTLPLIPRARVDKIPILSMAYGLSASADGKTFPWIFNPPATYWDGLASILRYIGQKEGGDVEKLRGKTIGYIYLDAGFGREPLPLFERLSNEFGFRVELYPIAASEMQNQTVQWLRIRRTNPEYLIMYGWGVMNPTAIKEAVKINFPMSRFISIWWPGEDDVRAAGEGSIGFQALNWHGVGNHYPALNDIQTYVVDKGLSRSTRDRVGQVLYNRGVYNSMLIAEGIRNAQLLTGKRVVEGTDVRRGLETINLTQDRLKALGFEGFAQPLKLTCRDHNGHLATYIQEWDGKSWKKASPPVEPIRERVKELIDAAAKDYADKNTGWPTRSEHCDGIR